MKKIIVLLKKMKISKRLVLYFSLLLAFQMVLIGWFSYRWVSSYLKNQQYNQMLDINSTIAWETNRIKSSGEQLSDRILRNILLTDEIVKIIETDYSSISAYQFSVDKDKVESILSEQTNQTNIVIISKNGILYQSHNNFYFHTDYNQVKNTSIYKMSLKSDGINIWIAENEDILGIDNVPYLYVCRTIRSTNQFRTLGQLIIQMPVDSFEGIFRQTSIVKGEYYSIIDKNGKVLYNTHDKAVIGKPSDADILSAISSNQGGYKIIRKENSSYLVVYSKYSSNDWNVVHVLPLDIVLSSARKVSNITLVIMLLSLIILSPLQLYLSRNISLPIKKLKNSVESFGNGNLDMRIKIDRLDEIGHLQLSFNKMAKDINSLLVKTEEKNKQLGLAELNMIKYQINPHFLYNSLDSINWMAQSAGNEDIEEMVTALARFFRIGLSKGKEFYKIGDELEHARQYLLINKIRFKDSFTFEVESEQDVLEYSTIRILLQPIVENAVKYGINKMDQTGHIQVTAVKADNAIIMKVSDNGAGIPYERLEIIRNVLSRRTQIDNVSTDGFGLFNVNQRIWMQFGEGYGIEIDSIEGKGTDVSIKIPLLD